MNLACCTSAGVPWESCQSLGINSKCKADLKYFHCPSVCRGPKFKAEFRDAAMCLKTLGQLNLAIKACFLLAESGSLVCGRPPLSHCHPDICVGDGVTWQWCWQEAVVGTGTQGMGERLLVRSDQHQPDCQTSALGSGFDQFWDGHCPSWSKVSKAHSAMGWAPCREQ